MNRQKQLLSDRERQILLRLSSGITSRELATDLFITTETVKTHRKNIMKKLGVKNSFELALTAVKQGLITY